MTVFKQIAAIAITVSAQISAAFAQPSGTIIIPFTPPTDKPLTYLLEKSDERDGKVVSETSIDRYSFTPDGDGYVLSVFPVSSTSTEADPDKIAIREAVEKAVGRRPYALVIDGDAQIARLVEGDKYWSAAVGVLKDELGKSAANPEIRQGLDNLAGMFEKMPAEVRLKLMTQHIQPMVEFALTELDPAKPIISQVETQGPTGGKLRQDVEIRIEPPVGGIVHMNLKSSIPRAEIERMTTDILQTIAGRNDKAKAAEIEKAITGLKEFRSETSADYYVAQATGVLDSYRMVRTIVVSDAGKLSTRVTTLRLTRKE